MPLRLWGPQMVSGGHTGGKTTAVIEGHTVATPRKCDYTTCYWNSSIKTSEKVGQCFWAVWRPVIFRYSVVLTDLNPIGRLGSWRVSFFSHGFAFRSATALSAPTLYFRPVFDQLFARMRSVEIIVVESVNFYRNQDLSYLVSCMCSSYWAEREKIIM